MSNTDTGTQLGDEVTSVFAHSQADHHARLAESTSHLRGRSRVPVDRWFQLIGGVLLGVGLIAILAGWYGASHTTREWRQTPYVVSGGLLGLGLIFIGGFSYFSYWMTRLVEESRRQTFYLESMEAMLRRQVQGDRPEAVVTTENGVAHRADCPVIAGRTDMRAVPPGETGLRPCPMCEPVLIG